MLSRTHASAATRSRSPAFPDAAYSSPIRSARWVKPSAPRRWFTVTTTTSPRGARLSPAQSGLLPVPKWSPPPWKKTMTGRRASGSSDGVHTFTTRQSSAGGSGVVAHDVVAGERRHLDLRARRPVCGRVANTRPRLCGHRRQEPAGTAGRRAVGDAEERHVALARGAAYLPGGRGDDGVGHCDPPASLRSGQATPRARRRLRGRSHGPLPHLGIAFPTSRSRATSPRHAMPTSSSSIWRGSRHSSARRAARHRPRASSRSARTSTPATLAQAVDDGADVAMPCSQFFRDPAAAIAPAPPSP